MNSDRIRAFLECVKTVRIALGICMVSILSGLIHGLILPWPEDPTDSSADPYRVAWQAVGDWQHAVWLDARPIAEFSAGTFADAIWFSYENYDAGFEALLSQWDGFAPIVVFCGDAACGISRQVAERLRVDLGTDEVYWLENGWQGLRMGGWVE